MAKRTTKPRGPAKKKVPTETPAGATRQAFDRPMEGSGPPGSGAGPRHAADDVGSENETFGRSDTTRTLASEPIDEPDALEKGPPYAGPSGGAVGGTPAQLRSSERDLQNDIDQESGDPEESDQHRIPPAREGMMRLTGFEAIEYAEKQGLLLNKHPDSITGPRVNLTVAEAEAIADDDADLIWLDVSEKQYYSGPPSSYEPQY